MTKVHEDQWHHVEVGIDWQDFGDENAYPQYKIKHGAEEECPKRYTKEGAEVAHFCQIGAAESFSGSDWMEDFLGEKLPYGLYAVRGRLTKDYWGEYDEEYDVVRLIGPVDERDFEGESIHGT